MICIILHVFVYSDKNDSTIKVESSDDKDDIKLNKTESDEEEDIVPEPNTTLFIKNLNFETTDESLKKVFYLCNLYINMESQAGEDLSYIFSK